MTPSDFNVCSREDWCSWSFVAPKNTDGDADVACVSGAPAFQDSGRTNHAKIHSNFVATATHPIVIQPVQCYYNHARFCLYTYCTYYGKGGQGAMLRSGCRSPHVFSNVGRRQCDMRLVASPSHCVEDYWRTAHWVAPDVNFVFLLALTRLCSLGMIYGVDSCLLSREGADGKAFGKQNLPVAWKQKHENTHVIDVGLFSFPSK